jgi:NAD(P)-dependent dehydrogenase (short-subunit alcohol dehydrogenase family)
VIATARRPETLADLPVDQRLRLDVTDQDSVDAAIRDAGDIDVLVSNAGETVRGPLESIPLAEVERLFQLNTLGALRVAQAVLPAMRERGAGRLVFVSSIQGRLVLPMIGPYSASKWALEALAETLAIETGHFGVKVSIVQPGAVSSGGGERAKVFLTENDPYAPLYEILPALRGESVTPAGRGRCRSRHDRAARTSAARARRPARAAGPAGPEGSAGRRALPDGRDQLVAATMVPA